MIFMKIHRHALEHDFLLTVMRCISCPCSELEFSYTKRYKNKHRSFTVPRPDVERNNFSSNFATNFCVCVVFLVVIIALLLDDLIF